MDQQLLDLIAKIRKVATYRLANGAYAEEPIMLTPEDALALVDEVEQRAELLVQYMPRNRIITFTSNIDMDLTIEFPEENEG